MASADGEAEIREASGDRVDDRVTAAEPLATSTNVKTTAGTANVAETSTKSAATVPIAIHAKERSGSSDTASAAVIKGQEGAFSASPRTNAVSGVGGKATVLDDAASVSNVSIRSHRSTSSTSTTTRPFAEEFLKRNASPSSASDRATTQLSEIMASPVLPSSSASSRPMSSAQVRDKNTVLASMVRRNYIYFTSLLQEPEAKWKPFSDNRGVTITQLDSIDPTLVVYRAEAIFVGVGIWDLFAAVTSTGVKNAWDRGAEQGHLLQDLGDASKLWWNKIKATWPVASRDSVVVETAYKSPSSIHVFSFSSDDRQLFPSIPSPDVNAIRTQIDLRGWSIERLSPTTAHITLIEQSDPKGWTSKASATPAAMTAAVAGIGDFAIKQGAPPIATKLRGARMKTSRYEYDKALTRIEYDLSVAPNQKVDDTASGNVECEIRCDVETWSPSMDVIVDPPPLNVRCVRRHKLSPAGGGLWITIEQATASLEDDPSRITVRKANNREKGVVYVNGAKMKTEVEELKEDEAAQLRDQKRTKPRRTPLDLVTDSPKKPLIGSNPPSGPISRTATPANGHPSVLSASNNLAAATGSGIAGGRVSATSTDDVFSDDAQREPMMCALDVLFLLRRIHAERSPDPAGTPAGWALVAQRGGMFVRRKLMQSISPNIMVQRSDKVVEGLTAENILAVVSNLSCRRLWDDKVDSARLLESYGSGATTGFFTTKASFPFRGRAFHLASLTARSGPNASQVSSGTLTNSPTVYFHASASYPEQKSCFSSSKLNPTGLPVGRVLIDGWIMETLDPYSSTLNYQIPSTRVTHLIALDYSGSLPVTVNAMWNTQLTRSIGLVEEYLKSKGSLPAIRTPPFCVEVLGDGRDDDHGLVWNLTDDRRKRGSTLISKEFDPTTKRYSILCTLNSQDKSLFSDCGGEEVSTPLAMPFPLRAHLPSNASMTRGFASSAALTPSTSRDSLKGLNLQLSDDDGATTNSAVSRTTSMNSIRSTTSKSRASVIRKDAKKATDLVVVDLEVELRHYEKGYEIDVDYELGPEPSSEGEDDGKGDEVESIVAKKIEIEGGAPDRIEFPRAASKASSARATMRPWSLQAASVSSDTKKDAADVNFVVSAFDMPPSAVLAATLDPSARPKKHMIRITLPTAAFLDAARSNPFYGPEPDDAPKWYGEIRRRGAVVRVRISSRGEQGGVVPDANKRVSSTTLETTSSDSGVSTPNGGSSGHSSQSGGEAEMDSQQVPVFYKGERMTVTHVNKTSAMLQRESEEEMTHAVLKRVNLPVSPRVDGGATGSVRKKTVAAEGLPVLLRTPLAIAESLKADAAGDVTTTQGKADGKATESHAKLITPSSSGEVGDLTLNTTIRGAGETPRTQASSVKASTPTSATLAPAATASSPTSAASAQILSILNSYPLSRLGGASTAVSTTVANGGVFSRKGGGADTTHDATNVDVSSTAQTDHKGGHRSAGSLDDEGIAGVPGQLIEATEQIRKRLADVKFNLSTLILVALIAFLLGSLVRSLLAPADFVLVKRLTGEASSAKQGADVGLQAVAVREIKRMLDVTNGQAHAAVAEHHDHATTQHDSAVAWRELRRLIEVRNLFGGRWDLVIAAVRR